MDAAHSTTSQKLRSWASSQPAKWTMAGLAAAGLLLLGGTVGYQLPDPTQSQDYASLADEQHMTAAERDRLHAEFTVLQRKYDELNDGLQSREDAVTQRENDVSAAESDVEDAEAAVTKREDAVSGAEEKKAANTVGPGTWVVGPDLEPGSYRADSEVSSSCYWGIYQSGSNGDEIIANDLPGGGRPTITLSAGEDFQSHDCGTWTKQ